MFIKLTLAGVKSVADCQQWNRTSFRLALIAKGVTEKVSQFKMPLKSIFSKKSLVLMNSNVLLNASERLKQ
jgi:hypothetical protein